MSVGYSIAVSDILAKFNKFKLIKPFLTVSLT